MDLKYLDVSKLPPVRPEVINNVIALDEMGNVIVSPLQTYVYEIKDTIGDINNVLTQINGL